MWLVMSFNYASSDTFVPPRAPLLPVSFRFCCVQVRLGLSRSSLCLVKCNLPHVWDALPRDYADPLWKGLGSIGSVPTLCLKPHLAMFFVTQACFASCLPLPISFNMALVSG
jgi:hypothetical protein